MNYKDHLICVIEALRRSLHHEEWTGFIPNRFIDYNQWERDYFLNHEALLESTEEELFSLMNIFYKLGAKKEIQEERKKFSCFMEPYQRAEIIKLLVREGPPSNENYQLPEDEVVQRYARWPDDRHMIGYEYYDCDLDHATDGELVHLLLVLYEGLIATRDRLNSMYLKERRQNLENAQQKEGENTSE